MEIRFSALTKILAFLMLWPAHLLAGEHQESWSCLTRLVSDLAATDNLVNSVEHHNQAPPGINYLEALWPTLSAEDPLVKNRIQHPAGEHMRTWIQEVSLQGEGLLIGMDGGLVAATEKTTDYWQADEAQFIEAINLPKGELFVQKEIVDESTHLMLVKISTPVFKDGSAIGVLVIGFDQFVIDFIEPCKGLN